MGKDEIEVLFRNKKLSKIMKKKVCGNVDEE
jgi:hypothetical protein